MQLLESDREFTAMRIAASNPPTITSEIASLKWRSIDISGKAARNSGSSGATCNIPKERGVSSKLLSGVYSGGDASRDRRRGE
jgi:hypothetical protein